VVVLIGDTSPEKRKRQVDALAGSAQCDREDNGSNGVGVGVADGVGVSFSALPIITHYPALVWSALHSGATLCV